MRFLRTDVFWGGMLVGLVAVLAPAVGAHAEYDDKNVVIVLDASGSMKGYMAGTQTAKI